MTQPPTDDSRPGPGSSGGPHGPDGARYADDGFRYRLDSRIATGGMGEVWRGTDTTLGRPVAVKLLKSEYADDPTFRSRFETEARHAAALHHPGVAAVYDVGESRAAGRSDGSGMPRPFLVMELVDGQPLSALLRGGRAMDPTAARDLLAQAADAVGAAHRAGIVHRDLKPANLLVTPDRKVKITDFGIARATDGLGLTGTGQVMGTPQYLSPEQARGQTATPASDVYSLGVVSYECLVGRRPFEADSPVATALSHLNDPVPTLPDSVPADLAAVVRRALAKNPTHRFADGDALGVALRDPSAAVRAGAGTSEESTQLVAPVPPAEQTQLLPATAAGPIVPTPPPVAPLTPAEPDPEDARSPWPVVLLVVALVVVAAVIVVLLVNRGGDDAAPADDRSTAGQPATTPDSPSTSPSTSDSAPDSESASPTTFSIDEGDYLGRDVDDVVAALKNQGLQPDTEEKSNPGGEDAGTVVSVSPTSGLEDKDTVRVVYWGQAEPSSTPTTPTPTATPTATPTPTPTPSQTPSSGGSASGASQTETPSTASSSAGA